MQRIKVKDQFIQKQEWKQTDGRTRPIAVPCQLTRSVKILKSAGFDGAIGNESAPIQLAQCRFSGLAISNVKI